MNPSITVLMPVWNGCSRGSEAFLRRAMESIIDQTMEDFEFLVVDDGSTDKTPEVLGEYASKDQRVRVLRNDRNLKIVRSLNRGIEEARAPLVARQDADDYSTVTRLEVQKGFMDARPQTAACGTGMYLVNGEGKLVREVRHPCPPDVVREELKSRCVFVHGSVMFRRHIVASFGGYSEDPDYEYAEDYELWARMSAAGHVLENIPDRSLYFHRDHPTKSSKEHQAQQEKATRLVATRAQKGELLCP